MRLRSPDHSREQEAHRTGDRHFHRAYAAARLHDLELAGGASVVKGARQPLDIAFDKRPDIGVEHRYAGAFILAEDRIHLAGDRDRKLGKLRANQLTRAALMNAVSICIQVADGHGLNRKAIPKVANRADHLRLVEGHQHLAGSADPLGDAGAHAAWRDEGRRFGFYIQVIHSGALLPSDLQYILEALGRETGGDGSTSFENGIGGDGCAMHIGQPQISAGFAVGLSQHAIDAFNNRADDIAAVLDLDGVHLAAVNETNHVREGAADIDTDFAHLYSPVASRRRSALPFSSFARVSGFRGSASTSPTARLKGIIESVAKRT
jgi:hypothetical protein